MRKHRIKNFVFSSTVAVYGDQKGYNGLLDEGCAVQPVNPHGYTKSMVEQILSDCETAYGMRYVCLRYFNAIGADESIIISYLLFLRLHRVNES
jgi:UDP-glucose 4-epimerase